MKKIFSLLFVAAFTLTLFSGCGNKNAVKLGDTVTVTYTASFPDGKLFEETTGQAQVVFTVGSGQVIAGLDEGVVGMNVGKTKTITVTPDKGYGYEYQENKLQKISQLIFDKLSIKTENGSLQNLGGIEGIVKGTEKDEQGNILVLFDINPRQTRDTLKYKVTVVAK